MRLREEAQDEARRRTDALDRAARKRLQVRLLRVCLPCPRWLMRSGVCICCFCFCFWEALDHDTPSCPTQGLDDGRKQRWQERLAALKRTHNTPNYRSALNARMHTPVCTGARGRPEAATAGAASCAQAPLLGGAGSSECSGGRGHSNGRRCCICRRLNCLFFALLATASVMAEVRCSCYMKCNKTGQVESTITAPAGPSFQGA